MDRTKVKAITGLLSRAAGLVFFAFLAISLGVIFGYLFEDWVKEQPGAAVQAPVDGSLDYPLTVKYGRHCHQSGQSPGWRDYHGSASSVRYKVKDRAFFITGIGAEVRQPAGDGWLSHLCEYQRSLYRQVGAFSSQANADRLRASW